MMMRVMDSSVGEKCLDPQLWHACAGGMVQMPAINSKVFYSPQGHAEHAQGSADFRNSRAPALILCKVVAIRYMADHETDDVYAKITLLPEKHNNEAEFDDNGYGYSGNVFDNPEKPSSFVKTLTQSDANNGGGFSVPRYCAETIFPRLDYSAEPPVQAILAKDVHGVTWKFRHIYRGTPRRHLLTTGWSNFVNQKKLVAGDSIVFLRAAESGELCVGIRRAKKGIGGGHEQEHHSSSWNPKGRAEIESAVEAAANGEAFEVVYYPRGSASSGSTPEFCVRASAVRTALQIQWCPGMRFKMPFETEDSSRISWFMGTISSVQVSDPVHWPDSPWRLLQVAWDEPDLLQNVKRVNPWLVELVASVPAPFFSPPRKRPRILQHSHEEFPLVGIQEARHNARFGPYQQDLHFHHPSLYHPTPSTAGLNFINILRNSNDNGSDGDISCWLRIGHNPDKRLKDEPSLQTRPLLLFGQVILTQDQLSNTSANLSDASNSSSDASGGGGGSPRDDSSGCVKIDEPFSEFLKTATRLGVLTEPHSDTAGF